jgi:hypothetical protein
MIESFDRKIPKAISAGISAILCHLTYLTKPEIDKYWAQMEKAGIAELINSSEQGGKFANQVQSQTEFLFSGCAEEQHGK